MQAVVTGSAGFIGSHLADALIARGHRVLGMDRQPRHDEPGYQLIRAGERGINRTVNLGTGMGHSLIEMATALLDVSGLDGDIVVRPALSDEADATLADTRVCRDLLGFVPTTDLRGLLARQLEAGDRIGALATA